MVCAIIVGTLTLASSEGAWQAFWLVLSVATLSGQATLGGETDRFVVMVLAVWMASNYATVAIGGAILWAASRARASGRRG